jgi:hypothetical protein
MVHAAVDPAEVVREMRPLHRCGCAIEERAAGYLAETKRQVVPFYEMEKAGGLKPGDPAGPAFATALLARAASELRDQIVEAWAFSATEPVGYKPTVTFAEVAKGLVDPYVSLYGYD